MKTENQSFWNNYSKNFAAIYGNSNNWTARVINKYFRKSVYNRFVETTNRIPASANSVLDIGCGPGHYCVEFAKKGISHVHGIDFSKGMIELAKLNSERLKSNQNLTFSISDIQKFCSNNTYDYTIMMGFIEYFKRPLPIINKALSLTNISLFLSFPRDGGLLAWQRKMKYKNRCFLKLYTENEIESLLENIKVSSAEILRMDRDYFVTISK